MKNLEHQCLDYWRSKPADEEYYWLDSQVCALGQFFDASGLGIARATGFLDAHGKWQPYPYALAQAAYFSGVKTFGAAADRLEALLADQSR